MFTSQYTENLLANKGHTGKLPSINSHLCIARPSNDLVAAEIFYVDSLGPTVLFCLTPPASRTPSKDHQDVHGHARLAGCRMEHGTRAPPAGQSQPCG